MAKESPAGNHSEKQAQGISCDIRETLQNGSAVPDTTQEPTEKEREDALQDSSKEDNGKPENEEKEEEEQEDKRSEKIDWHKLLRMLRVLSPFFLKLEKEHAKFRIVGIFACVLATRILRVLEPLLLGQVIDSLGDPKNVGVPWNTVSTYFLVRGMAATGGIDTIQSYLWQTIEWSIGKRVTLHAYYKFMDMSSDFHDNRGSHRSLSTIDQSYVVPYLVNIFFLELTPVLVDFVVAVQIFYSVFDIYMATIFVLSMALYLAISERTLRRSYAQSDKSRKDDREQQRIFSNATRNWDLVTHFNKIQDEKEHYASALEKSHESGFHASGYLDNALEYVAKYGGMAFCCCLAAAQIKASGRGPGEFVSMMTYWAQVTSPFELFMWRTKSMVRYLSNADELVELLEAEPSIQDKLDASEFEFKKGVVEFKNVDFSYDGKREILKSISLKAEPGQTIGFVGTTGEGKSTILKSIFRLYDISGGSVAIDGQDVRDVKMCSFRKHIGVVPQDSSMFNVSILENLRYAKSDATVEECQEACRATTIHDKIMTFPDGYSTTVGDRGVKLSGGELQRLAIARAMLKDPEIVLLDEATSSVDSETEARIQANLRKWTKGRTTFIVAHRLSTIQHANVIFVIKHGQVVERGSHQKLLDANGHYARMWRLQTGEEVLEEVA